ncbi:MAG: 23S rRNA pseudouridine2605 synthase [Chitinophagales bacterium]|jgi:23S rRNA pseudouridine2605 synthase
MSKKGPYKKKPNNQEEQKEIPTEMRLNKFLAHSGVASRRKADEYISQGLIKVNGKLVTEVGMKVKPSDKVEYEGRPVKPERKVYILLNKPKGYITTTDDEKDRKTVMDLVKNVSVKLSLPYEVRLYPVGRLDRNTSGVLLLTNDGDLSLKLTHPSHSMAKIYKAVLNKPLSQDHFEALQEGTELEDGMARIDELAYVDTKDGTTLGIEIHMGKNRIVRRLFEHYGYVVEKLDRMVFAGLTKKDLPRGRWRSLKDREVLNLKHFKK